MNTPYLYFGMWKTTFSWHVEDMDLYGINFLHHGAPKTWYCVPPQYGHMLEKAAQKLFPDMAGLCSNFMRHKTCLISPQTLQDLGVPFQRVVQEERDIIIVFPYAYHAGFNHGFNIAEATNFATERWIEYGKRQRPCDCSITTVKIDMGIFVKRFQPECYQKWLKGKDIAPHPEDPEDVKQDVRLRAENPEAYTKMMEKRMHVDNKGIVLYTTRDGKNLRYDTRKKKLLTKLKLGAEEVARFKRWQTSLQRLLDQTNARQTVLDEYQHHEIARLKVKVKHGTTECVGKGLGMLRQFLGKPDLKDIKALIRSGEMIKTGEKTFMRDLMTDGKSTGSDGLESREMGKKLITAHCFKHILEDDIEAVVDPETMELVDKPSEILKTFLTTETIKEVIDTGAFRFSHTVTREIEEKVDSKPTQGKHLRDDVLDPMCNVDVFEVMGTEFRIKIIPKTMRVLGGLPTTVKAILKGKTIKEAITNGQLKYMKTIRERKRDGKEAHEMETDVRDVYITGSVNPSAFCMKGRSVLNPTNQWSGDDARAMIASGDLIKIGTKVVKTKGSTETQCNRRRYIFRTFVFKKDNVEEEVELCLMGKRSVLRLPLISPQISNQLVTTDYASLVKNGNLVMKHATVKNGLEMRNLLEASVVSSDTIIESTLFDSDKNIKVNVNINGTKNARAGDEDHLPFDIRHISVEELEAGGILQNPREIDPLLGKFIDVLKQTRPSVAAHSVQMMKNKEAGCLVLTNLEDGVLYLIKGGDNEAIPDQHKRSQKDREDFGNDKKVSNIVSDDSDHGDDFDEYISGDDLSNPSSEESVNERQYSDDDFMPKAPSYRRTKKRKKNKKSITQDRTRRGAKCLRTES